MHFNEYLHFLDPQPHACPCSETYDVVLVSPRNYFLYTPLLPGWS